MAVVVAIVVAAAALPRLLQLSAALLRLPAVFAVTPHGFVQIQFGFANALFAFVVPVSRLRGQNAAD